MGTDAEPDRGRRPAGAREWPRWPQFDERTADRLLETLRSGRWTVTWFSNGEAAAERRFAQAFARYLGVAHGVSVDHGTSAIVVALEALDVGHGDEVILPALTWVACATAILNVGAVPVLVDIDGETGCIDPASVERAVTSRTRAILAVHLHCTMADVDALGAIARATGVPLIEDCSQAHGARWRGAAAGSFGAAGAFSLQQSKVLTGGEGGIVVTDDTRVYERALALRADGRRYCEPTAGQDELAGFGGVMGTNHCMSEFTASVLLDQLPRLDAQHAQRNRQAVRLRERLAGIPGLRPIGKPAQVTHESIYELAMRRGPRSFGGAPTATVAERLSAHLGFEVYLTDPPLPRSPLFAPWTKRRYAFLDDAVGLGRDAFPQADRFHDEVLLFHHRFLLAPDDAIDAIGDGFEQVHAALVRELR